MPRIVVETDDEELVRFVRTPDQFMRFVDVTVDQARDMVGAFEGAPEEFDVALDEMQGEVFSGKATATYVIIKIN